VNHGCLIVFVVLAGLVTVAGMVGQSKDIVAQNQTVATPGSVTNFTKLVEDKFTFDRLGLGFTIPDLEVLYESPTTLVLRGKAPPPEFTSLGQVIDIAKQNGYRIDTATVFTESSRPVAGTVTLTDVYTVFMAKE
jgi:hypothetical protein